MMKWLCTLPILKLIYRQGGIDSFHHAHKDIWDTMKDDVEKMADDRLKAKMQELLTIVDDKAIITFSTKAGAVYIGGERLVEGELQNLKAEAEFFALSRLWKVLHETPKELAQRAMFVAGESQNDMIKGRAILYTLDTQKRILDTLKAYTQPQKKAVDGMPYTTGSNLM